MEPIFLQYPLEAHNKSYKLEDIEECLDEEKNNSENENKLETEELVKLLFQLSINQPVESDIDYEDQYNDIPLLNCQKTADYISKSKIMVIMKGLPGSGKSTIVKAIARKYTNSSVCSADNFFGKGDRYKFDAEKLPQAHGKCRRDAVAACENGRSPIVIDNTNIHQWEMKFYLKLADAFNYLVVVVEPDTPWSKDADILALKNSHSVDAKVLKKKIKNYETISPLYFGWFLNESDSFALCEKARDWLNKIMQVPEFRNDFRKRANVASISELLSHFSGGSYALQDTRIVHCTSRYTAKEDYDFLEGYLKSKKIKKAVGRVTSLSIVGFLVTPNTLGARVALSEEQLTIWADDGDEDEILGEKKRKRKRRFYGPSQATQEVIKIPDYSPQPATLRDQSSLIETPLENNFQTMTKAPYAKGRRAHITLGTTVGIPPVTTGLELLQLLDGDDGIDQGDTEYSIPGAKLRNHGRGFWGIYPDRCISVKALFTYHL